MTGHETSKRPSLNVSFNLPKTSYIVQTVIQLVFGCTVFHVR